jgi:hypothetical protein
MRVSRSPAQGLKQFVVDQLNGCLEEVEMSNENLNSEVMDQAGSGEMGSLESGIAGDYPLEVRDVIGEAWQRSNGKKGTLWIAIIMYLAILMVLSFVLNLFSGAPPAPAGAMPETSPASLFQQLVTGLVATPLWVGIVFIGVAVARNRPAAPKSIFSWYDLTLKLFFTYLLMGLLILLGTMLLVLPGIYLAVSYQLALPLVADKRLGPWQAMEASRKAVTRRWFTFFILWLIGAAAILLSMVLVGIPLIWVLPVFIIAIGIVYRNVFGVEEESLRRVAGN